MRTFRISSHQLSLDLVVPEATENTSAQHKVVYEHFPVAKSTFKAGLAARVHRWFRLTPSFGPDLVQKMLSDLQCGPGDVVLDPFAGAGTTLVECQLEGLTCYGLEINPFLHFVCETSLRWQLDVSQIECAHEQIGHLFNELDRQYSYETLTKLGITIPNIHDPLRWWRKDVLKRLLLLKKAIGDIAADREVRHFLLLALAAVLVPDLTNVTLGRLQLHFIDRSKDEIDVWGSFTRHAREMTNDLQMISRLGIRETSQVFKADSTDLQQTHLPAPARCVITSPPYPNRYSYVWNTRPHLYLLDFFTTPREASALDKRTIGGTWGTATSCLSKGRVEPLAQVVADVVEPVASKIRQGDRLMANYLTKYFNLLTRQIINVDQLLTSDARLAYVIGCSELKGVYVETDIMLGKIFEGLNFGYKVSRIERIRRRHSGKDLHESIVYVRRERG